jgi:hypothetical protein
MPQRSKSWSGVDDSSWFSLMLWRLSAAASFALALLFIKHGLLGAVILLLVAVFCLPGTRAGFRQKTGVRIPGAANVAVGAVLALCGVVSAGLNADVRPRGVQLAGPLAAEVHAGPGLRPPGEARGQANAAAAR